MMRTAALAVLVCLLIAALPAGVYAVEMRTGNSVVLPKTESANDDVLAAGNRIVVEPSVTGDVTAAGGNVTVSGPVRDSVLLAGGNVRVSGGVGNDAYLAGGTLDLSAPVRDNAYLAGGTITVDRRARIGKDLLVSGGTIDILGNVGRDVRVAGGNIAIGGTVGGDVYAASGGTIRLLDGAVIRGDFRYQSPNKAAISPGARVLGEIRQTIPPEERRRPVFWPKFLWWLASLLGAILFGIAVLLLFPARSQAAADLVRNSFLLSLGVGALALIVTPVACAILAMTLIGIPLAIAVFAIYLILLYAAKVFVALAIGRWVWGRARTASPNLIVLMITGLVILAIIELIPLIGWLVWLIVLLAGLGAFVMSWWRGREPVAAPITQPAAPAE